MVITWKPPLQEITVEPSPSACIMKQKGEGGGGGGVYVKPCSLLLVSQSGSLICRCRMYFFDGDVVVKQIECGLALSV